MFCSIAHIQCSVREDIKLCLHFLFTASPPPPRKLIISIISLTCSIQQLCVLSRISHFPPLAALIKHHTNHSNVISSLLDQRLSRRCELSESAYEFNTWNTTNLFRFFDRFTLFFTPRSTSSLIQFLLYVSPSSFFVSKSLFLTLEQINNLFTLYFFSFLFESSYIWCESLSSRVSRIEAISFQLFLTLPSTVNNPLLSLQFFFSLFIHSRRLMRCPERFKSLLAVFFCCFTSAGAFLSHLEKEIHSLEYHHGGSSARPTSFPLIFYAIWMNKSINGSPTNRRWDPIHVCAALIHFSWCAGSFA